MFGLCGYLDILENLFFFLRFIAFVWSLGLVFFVFSVFVYEFSMEFSGV